MTPGERKAYERGVKVAAELAGDYDSSSTHPYRLEDCILGKLNVPGAPLDARRNKHAKKNNVDDSWDRGFGIALAEVNRRWAHPTLVAAIVRDEGLTIAKFKKAGLAEFDLKQLRKCLK